MTSIANTAQVSTAQRNPFVIKDGLKDSPVAAISDCFEMLDHIFHYLGPKDLVAVSKVCTLFNMCTSDLHEGTGKHLWENLTDSQWMDSFKKQFGSKLSVIDKSIWESSPTLSAFLNANALSIPDHLGLDYRNQVIPGLKALDSLKIEDDVGYTYIVIPQGITFQILSDLFAKVLRLQTCFRYITPLIPPAYYNTPVEKAYALVISNSIIEHSSGQYLGVRKALLHQSNCEMSEAIEVLMLITLRCVLSLEPSRWFHSSYTCLSSTYTCAKFNNLFLDIGGLVLNDGLLVNFCSGGDISHLEGSGVGASRKFIPALSKC